MSEVPSASGNPFLIGFQESISQLENCGKLALYTSASTAYSLIQNKTLWLRNARLMNDFQEVEFGSRLLKSYWNKPDNHLVNALRDFDPSLIQRFNDQLNSFDHVQINDTYLTSMTHHTDSDHGRLSMWRAYGGDRSVAVVFDVSKFVEEGVNVAPVAMPVRYATEACYSEYIDQLAETVASYNCSDPATLSQNLFTSLFYSVLTTKHIGFAEEKEWRLLYSPSYSGPPHLACDIETPTGVPEKVYKLPIDQIPLSGGEKVVFEEILAEIIIGPTTAAFAIKEAFEEIIRTELGEAVSIPVKISGIPLRR